MAAISIPNAEPALLVRARHSRTKSPYRSPMAGVECLIESRRPSGFLRSF
jgi:hypothetical protein